MSRQFIHIVIPGLTPPSVNHYVTHPGRGVHLKTKEAKAFHDAAVLFARQALARQGVLPVYATGDNIVDSVSNAVFTCTQSGPRGATRPAFNSYEVMMVVWYAKGESGDIDNRAKIPLDALVTAGVISSDAAIVDLHLHKRRDRENPRTELWVRQAKGNVVPEWV